MKKISLLSLVFFIVPVISWAAVTTKLEVKRDRWGQTDAIEQSTFIDVRVLAAGVAESHTVPTGAKYVIFSCVNSDGNAVSFWADFVSTAAIPSGDITDGSGCEVNPIVRDVSGVTTISLIAPEACIVTMSFYLDTMD